MRSSTFYNSNHHPFGMQMPSRNHNSSDYKYGFNGKMKDDELKTNGNSYDFGARLYDPRLGRWLAVDPLIRKFPSQSPYNFCLNSPMLFVDPDGKVVHPVDQGAAKLWDQFKQNADKRTLSIIKILETSEIQYNINYSTTAKDPGGATTWLTSTQRDDSQPQIISIDIFALKGEKENVWAINALGDEVVGAYQFEIGDIGFASDAKTGNIIPTGYDYCTSSDQSGLKIVKS